MAPVNPTDHDVVEKQIKNLIQDLYQLMVQVETYDRAGKSSRDVLAETANTISTNLLAISRTTSATNHTTHLPSIPPELVQYVDNGRNPDIYTREFVELARKGNQLMKGKMEAFASFRDVLAGEMGTVLPELEQDVRDVVLKTGGKAEVVPKQET